jgi:hypothetical protein
MFWFTSRRREKARSRPFPAEWQAVLDRRVPYHKSLTTEEQAELRGHIQVFLDEKVFEGALGLEITDEIRVTIAAQACILLLHRETDYYPDLGTIVVYPQAYVAREKRLEGGVLVEREVVRLGESWARGTVVLSWRDVVSGAANTHDGHNVVFHEFAHQLDQEDGSSDGAPVLSQRAGYGPWARVFGAEYANLEREVERHHRTLIDSYGAENPAEFFAVATETFFEKPRQLRADHPALYDQLAHFYRQDPAAREDRKG